MNHIEAKLAKAGFHKLQEKEDMIYFDKMTDFKDSSIQQVCLVYDKMNRKLKSIDTFILSEGNMRMVYDSDLQKQISNLLSS